MTPPRSTDNGAMRIFKVGSFYPYAIVAARSPEDAESIVRASHLAPGQVNGIDENEMEIRELDASSPRIIDVNTG